MKSRCGIILMVVITILVIALCVAGLFLTVMLFEDELNPLAVFQGGASNRYSDPNAYPWAVSYTHLTLPTSDLV